MLKFEIDLDEVTWGIGKVAHSKMDGDAARTIYFALSEYRDSLVKDIARYDDLGKTHYQECEQHGYDRDGYNTPWCKRCQEVANLRTEGHRLEKHRDEDLMFLGDVLNRVTTMLFELGGNNSEEFRDWLGV